MRGYEPIPTEVYAESPEAADSHMTEMRVEGDFGGHLRHKCEACGVTPVRYDFSVCDKCADAAGWCPHCHQTGGTHDEDCPNRTWSR